MGMTEQEMKAKNMRNQDMTYQHVANLVKDDWTNFYPKTNLIWIKYIINKVLKAKVFEEAKLTDVLVVAPVDKANKTKPKKKVKKTVIKENDQVFQILHQYLALLDKCSNVQTMFNQIVKDSKLNDCVRIIYK